MILQLIEDSTMALKVLAFNASPHMEKSNTTLIFNPFLDGLKEEGASIETFYISQLKINPCLGDLNCWTRISGKCTQKDDVEALLPKIQQANILVFAFPLYVDGMPGPMKTLVDRLIALLDPYVVLKDGHCRHSIREKTTCTKLVLVSNCGFWELDNFAPLIAHAKAICKNTSWEYAGALLRPHGPALGYMLRKGYPVQDVLDAAKKAGKELAKNGKISEETLKTIGRELVPLNDYIKILNQGFEKARERAKLQK